MLKTFGVWAFGGRDNWRSGHFPSRLLAVGTFGAFQKAHFPGHFLPRLLVLRTFPAQTFGAQDISCPDFWRLGQLALSKRPISRTFPAQSFGTPKNFYKTLSTKEALTLVLVLSSGLTLRRRAFVISFHHSFMRTLILSCLGQQVTLNSVSQEMELRRAESTLTICV